MVYTDRMFTVKQLSKMAGVTPRTLHYYDEIGLLEPSRIGDNGYRYYGEEATLHLQQILFYRELDMSLEDIKQILGRHDFDVVKALESHREQLLKRISHLERMVNTVDDTILHVKGEKLMSQKQLFEPFNEEQQAEYQKEAERIYDPEVVKASNQKWKRYSAAEKQRISDEGIAIYENLAKAMPKGAGSPEVQDCIERWHKHLQYFWSPNDEQLLGLAEMYCEDPRFKANFDRIHPDLAAFMKDAVKVYVEKIKK
jgi:MerR family transcriptional regulator, thiopeptide resistance regulator